LRVGIGVPHYGPDSSAATMGRFATEAEDLGYASLWVLERTLRPRGPVKTSATTSAVLPASFARVFAPLETLAYIAALTKRIRLGTSVLDALLHPPASLARRVATLDNLSSGRVLLGLGQGWMPEEYLASGVPLTRRGAGFEEYIAALRACWAPDPVHFEGRFFVIPESDLGPKPVQPGGPPIYIGAMAGPAIDRAGRIADGFNPDGLDLDHFAPTWEALRAQIDRYQASVVVAGRPAGDGRILVRANVHLADVDGVEGSLLSGTPREISDGIHRLADWGVDEAFIDMSMHGAPIATQIRVMNELRSRLGDSYFTG
jgi:probable F420-dependent oxidoreductase